VSAAARFLAACALALAVAPAAYARDPSPIREHPGKPQVETVGDTTAVAAPSADSLQPAAGDTSLAFLLRHAPRTRLMLGDAVRYEGDEAFADSMGIAFRDPELAGLHFPWPDIATVEVSGGDHRWLGFAIGATVGLALGVVAAGPTLDEEGLVSGSSLDALRLVTDAVTTAFGGFIGWEIGKNSRRWEQVYPP
jgi:hypothetical protein